jgi:hypothetical protein
MARGNASVLWDKIAKAQEYLALAENTVGATLRSQYLLMAKELSELAAMLDGKATPKPA